MDIAAAAMLLAILVAAAAVLAGGSRLEPFLRLPSEGGEDAGVGTRWAVLIAGSAGYGNYRHQADVCHAYQIMKKGGLSDDNIIVFMYDDIAFHRDNPRPGVVINRPGGADVYAGVPKDYTGPTVTAGNFYAALLGNTTAPSGGSGKVLASGPDDHVFIYYTDHGGPGVLGMPTGPNLYADDLVAVLKKMHAAGKYKSLVFYLEACESGSIFEGLLPEDIGIYATTASNSYESSWATYCPGDAEPPPPDFYTCLGDLYSVAWMEDSDVHNLRTESLRQQYQLVKERTSVQETYLYGSHVMQFGELELNAHQLFLYMGSNPANDNATFAPAAAAAAGAGVAQRDADLIYHWHKFLGSAGGSPERDRAQEEFLAVMEHRMHVDDAVALTVSLLFGAENGPGVAAAVRPAGQPLVDDWSCLKSVVRAFEEHCGSLGQYGMKHTRTFANICNAGGVGEAAVAKAAALACPAFPDNPLSSLENGFSA